MIFLWLGLSMSMYTACGHEQYRVQQGFVERDGYNITYSIEGQGQPIVILGPVVYHQRIFSQNLRKHAQLIFINHRGFLVPQSPGDASLITIDTLLDDFEYVRSQLGIEKFTFVGHSAHGLLGLEYAKKYPEHVERIVVIAIGPDLSAKSAALAEQYFQDSLCPERKLIDQHHALLLPSRIAANPDKKFIIMLMGLAARSWYDYNFDPIPLWDGVEVNMPVIERVWGKLFAEIDIIQGLSDVNKPVLLMLGKFDYLIAPFFVWNNIRFEFQDLTMQLFEHSGHTPCFEEPELFDRQLLAWMSKH